MKAYDYYLDKITDEYNMYCIPIMDKEGNIINCPECENKCEEYEEEGE